MPDSASAEQLAEQFIERLRFRRAPLAAAAGWFAAGILLARYVAHPPLQLVVSLLLLATIAVLALENRLAWLPMAALWITLGVAALDWQPMPPTQAALLAHADNLSRTVRAHIIRVRTPPPLPKTRDADADPVPPWESTEDTTHQRGQPLSLDLALDQIEQVIPDTSTMIPISGGIRLAVYEPTPAFTPHCGQLIEAPLRLKPPDRYRTPAAFDSAAWLLSQGIAAHASIAANRIVSLTDSPATLPCRLAAAQSWASARLTGLTQTPAAQRLPLFLRLTPADALMLDAMLFGDRTGLTHTLRTGFERTGTFHLFVVSGLHIALVATGLFWLQRKLRFPIWAATLLTLAGTTAYAALTGFGQPVQRALAMTAVFLLARLLSRDRDPLNALGAALLAMLVLSPSSLFDASFQMTALIVLAIAGIAVPLAQRTPIRHAGLTRFVFRKPRPVVDPRAGQLLLMLELWGETLAHTLPFLPRRLPAAALRTLLRIAELILISAVAELTMVLPMAVYFHRLTVFSVPANLLILPLIGFLVPAALATFLATLISAQLALAPAALTAALLHAITFAIHRFSALHTSDVRIPAPVWWLALAAIPLWIACSWLARRSRSTAIAAAFLLPLVAACLLWPEPPIVTPDSLELTALDVGQGDSLLAVNPIGQTMLIDAGGPIGQHGSAETFASFDVGEQVVAPYLWSRRLRRLDLLVLSHAHTDHMGGMPAILDDLRPRELWVGIDPVSPLYAALLAQAARLDIPVHHLHAGDRLPWGPVQITVLAPAAGYTNLSAPRNDDSLVLRLDYGQSSVLLEGDAERPSEDTMLAAGLLHPVTLLKVGHHGSKTSSNPEFLAAVQPREAVISVGRNNTFGHPRAEVLERLAAAHTRVYRTDLFGLRTFLLTPNGEIRDTDQAASSTSVSAPVAPAGVMRDLGQNN